MNSGKIDLRSLKRIEDVQALLCAGDPDKKVTKKEAQEWLRAKLPKESILQKNIMVRIKAEFPQAFVRKVSLGAYSEAGIPDVLAVVDGIYFGIEVKRPIIGKTSPLQLKTIEEIRAAGGVAGIVCWPEDAVDMIRERLNK